MLYNSPLNFFFLSKYTFIRFMTFYNRGSPVGWNRGVGGGRGKRRAPLGGRVFLGGKIAF